MIDPISLAAMSPRPFRFSSPITIAGSRVELRDQVRKLEDFGYSTATMSDHIDGQLGPIASLMAIAEASTTLRIAPLVFSNDFRHPVVLAKEAATLDLLSEGRLEFGLGAGWQDTDYDRAGIDHDPAGVRIARLAEALAVVKALWADGPLTHEGPNYRVTDLEGMPKPYQRPHPPIIVGGGARKVLELAGREADIVGFNPSMAAGRIDASAGPSATPRATDHKVEWVRAAAGDRFDHLELHVRLQLSIVVDDPEPLFEEIGGGFGLTAEEARHSPYALAGPVEAMVDALLERRERWGFSYIGIPYGAAEVMAPVVSKLAGT